MADETFLGGIGGIAQGATAGFAVGGPVGAFIGGGLGLIGGIAGGNAAKRARKYQNIAAKFEARSKIQQAALARRDLLRAARIQQANAIAFAASEEGGLQSSASQGARASSQSQLGFNLGYLQNQFTLQRAVTENLARAGRAQNQAQDIFGLTATLANVASTIGPTIPQRPPSALTAPSPVGPAVVPGVSAPYGLPTIGIQPTNEIRYA